MDRRFVTWLFVASLCLLGFGVATVSVHRAAQAAEHRLRVSLLLDQPVAAAARGLEPGSEHLAPLLRAALSEGRPEQVLALLRSRDAMGAYPVHTAAALFELGAAEESRSVWQGEGASGFERRLRAARDLDSRGAVDLVRDRRGRLLGGFASDGSFQTLSSVPPEVLPGALLDRLRDERPFPGRRLSIDLELSLLALEALRGSRGSIVLVDAQNGELLAAVSDGHTWARGGTPSLEQRREPASIAKLLTTSAALRAGIDPDEAIASMRCRGSIRLGGELLYCSSIDGRLSGLDHALAVSCNVAFAQLGLLVGDEGLREEYRRFGFAVGDETGHPYLGRVHRREHDERSLGNLAIGLDEVDITPLHAALVAAAFARGSLLSPHLLHAADGRLGLSPRPLAESNPVGLPLRTALLVPQWLAPLHRAMAAVAATGTARRVAPRAFPVIMKTGTGRDPGRYFHVNYVGAGPIPEPRIAFAVRLTDGRTSRRVRRAAYGVTRRLLSGLASAEGGLWRRPVDRVQITEALAERGAAVGQ